jgi:erythromycin esterase-like protein
MLDLRSAPGDVAKWLDTGVEMRAIGSTFSPGTTMEYARTKPREEYDAIVFVDTMHPSHPTPTGERPRHAK